MKPIPTEAVLAHHHGPACWVALAQDRGCLIMNAQQSAYPPKQFVYDQSIAVPTERGIIS